ncbi:MAG TPA: L-seryl-tRNA(Sec) selenium transferase [Acidimicrobiales bacterium]|nr:L-seryl-tRNA(Sec) selenium transferase [Acidimicrobiales bacterium]
MTGRPPSVDYIARQLAGTGLPHPLLVDAARRAVSMSSGPGGQLEPEEVLAEASRVAWELGRGLLQPVINATGVLLHTNLGRAPVAVDRPAGYSNLELDLVTGRRGDRSDHAAALMARACGSEAALVVNNGAAAVLLALTVLAADREVLVSRGELVEIGGGFRVPEVLAQSGARLVEVGTTNRTRLADYRAAAGPETALVLKVHTSNYTIRGFTESVEVKELAGLGLPVIADLGSGLLDARCPWLAGGPPGWLAGEPAAVQTLAAGAALVTFSGDKLLGGPQAGIIAGSRDLVQRCRRHPLARALRPGGLVLEALQEVALSYLRRDAGRTVPLWRMAGTPVEVLRRRAEAIGAGEVVECESVMGGGTLPTVAIPSAGVALPGDVTSGLRRASPPVVAHVRDGRTICDLRTVFEEQDQALAKALAP